jgi:hypothetical protein
VAKWYLTRSLDEAKRFGRRQILPDPRFGRGQMSEKTGFHGCATDMNTSPTFVFILFCYFRLWNWPEFCHRLDLLWDLNPDIGSIQKNYLTDFVVLRTVLVNWIWCVGTGTFVESEIRNSRHWWCMVFYSLLTYSKVIEEYTRLLPGQPPPTFITSMSLIHSEKIRLLLPPFPGLAKDRHQPPYRDSSPPLPPQVQPPR